MSNQITLPKGGPVVLPPAGQYALFVDTDGTTKQVDSAGVVSTLGAGGATPASWSQAMRAFALTQYSTMKSDPLFSDFVMGTTGDYSVISQNGHGVVNVSQGFKGGVAELDTGSTTVSGDKVGAACKGNPALVANLLTGGPWFIAARAETATGVDATGQAFPIGMVVNAGTTTPPFLGCYGPTSTTNYVFYVSGSTQIDTGIPIVTGVFKDFGIGFDGVTLVPYYGDVLAGTFAAIAGKSSTDTSGLVTSSGGPIGVVVAGAGAVRIRIEQDKLFGLCPVP